LQAIILINQEVKKQSYVLVFGVPLNSFSLLTPESRNTNNKEINAMHKTA